MPNPADRKYSKEHEWVLMESDGSARIGITDFAQTELGDVVYVQLPRVGDTVTQFSQMGEVESVKAVSELFCPSSHSSFGASLTMASPQYSITQVASQPSSLSVLPSSHSSPVAGV